jgi:hypothetical protein
MIPHVSFFLPQDPRRGSWDGYSLVPLEALDAGAFLALVADAPESAAQNTAREIEKFIQENLASLVEILVRDGNDHFAFLSNLVRGLHQHLLALSDPIREQGAFHATIAMALCAGANVSLVTVGDAVAWYGADGTVFRRSNTTAVNSSGSLHRTAEGEYLGSSVTPNPSLRSFPRLPGHRLLLASDGAELSLGGTFCESIVAAAADSLATLRQRIQDTLPPQICDDLTLLLVEIV